MCTLQNNIWYGIVQNPKYLTASDSGVIVKGSCLYVMLTVSALLATIPSTVINFVFVVLT